jgi:hypothetical protein
MLLVAGVPQPEGEQADVRCASFEGSLDRIHRLSGDRLTWLLRPSTAQDCRFAVMLNPHNAFLVLPAWPLSFDSNSACLRDRFPIP